jgi:hypothetical protein
MAKEHHRHDKAVKYDKSVAVLKRPLYKAGLLLEADDLTAAVEYTRNMSRLLFRSLFGCGVICGLEVTAQLTCNRTRVEVMVSPGVGLDCEGNPIHVPKAFKIVFDAKCDPLPEKLWVTLCYIQQCCAPRDISCSVDEDGHPVQTRVIDGFEVRLYARQPSCACSCLEPPEDTAPTPDPCCADTAPQPAAAPQQAQAQGGEAAATAVPTSPPICECFYDHWNGKCECECCCNCIFIGLVDVTLTDDGDPVADATGASIPLQVTRDGVRWIRPMLVGYYKCPEAQLPAPATPPPQQTPILNRVRQAQQRGAGRTRP